MYKKWLLTALILSSAKIVFADSLYNSNFYINGQSNTKPVSMFSQPKNGSILAPNSTSGAVCKSLIEPEFSSEILFLQDEISKSPNNIQLHLDLAKAFDKNGNNADANKEFNFLLNYAKTSDTLLSQIETIFTQKASTNPSYENFSMLGDIYFRQGKNDLAMEYYQKAIMKNTASLSTKIKIANIYLKNKDYQKALPIYEKALMTSPYSTEIRLKKADCLLGLGNKDSAKAEYKMILSRKPNNGEAIVAMYEMLANEAMIQDDIIKNLYPDYKTKPIDAEVYKNLAISLRNAGKTEDSITFFKQAVAIESNDAASYIDIAELYSQLGQKDKAKEALEVAQRILPGDSTLRKKYNKVMALTSDDPLQEALMLIKNGLYEDAITVYESIEPKNVDVLTGIASCYQYLNKPEEALIYLDKAHNLEPENSDVYYYYAFLFVNQEDYSKAKLYIKKSLEYNPENLKSKKLSKFIADQESNKLMDKAFNAYDTQNYQESLRLLNEVIKISPNNPDAIYYKGLVFVSQNKHQLGINEFNKVAKIKPNFPLVYYSLGVAYDSLGKKYDALAAYKKYLILDKEDSAYVKYSKQRVSELSKK